MEQPPSLHRLADNGFPVFRVSFADVDQVNFVMPAYLLPVAGSNEPVEPFNGGALFGEQPDMHDLRTVAFRP